MPGGDVLVSVRNITTKIGSNIIHENLSLEIRRGDSLSIIGGSGAGKSVLLQAILGLRRPAAGEVIAFGKNIYDASEEELREVCKRWGVLFQSGALFTSQTVSENIKFPMQEYTRLSPTLIDRLALLKLDMAGLQPSAGDKYPSELSGGMKKRAGLARALALDPELLFLDEPTSGLDPITSGKFDNSMLELRRALGLTIVMVTHDFDSLFKVSDKVAVLANKKIAALVPAEKLFEVDIPWVQELSRETRTWRAFEAHMQEKAAAGEIMLDIGGFCRF
ncbi:MAG: ATP-binding cassette domain-containing protein [Desulfovibrionaceae bacterium]|nr:ATP-binding cassette domain-containing protein [Desulfovibrionaceae bacterium]